MQPWLQLHRWAGLADSAAVHLRDGLPGRVRGQRPAAGRVDWQGSAGWGARQLPEWEAQLQPASHPGTSCGCRRQALCRDPTISELSTQPWRQLCFWQERRPCKRCGDAGETLQSSATLLSKSESTHSDLAPATAQERQRRKYLLLSGRTGYPLCLSRRRGRSWLHTLNIAQMSHQAQYWTSTLSEKGTQQ